MSEFEKNGRGGQPIPYSRDAERGVLGSLLLGGLELIGEISDILSPEMFFVPANVRIYYTLLAMAKAQIPPDIITLTNEFIAEGCLEEVGGGAFVADLFEHLQTAGNILHYAAIVRQMAVRRQIMATCTDALRKVNEEQHVPVEDQLDELQNAILQIGELTQTEHTAKHLKEGLTQALDGIEQLYYNRGKCMHLSTGLVDLDRMTNGLKPKQYYIIAARPSMGKTAIALNMAMFIAKEKPVIFFSLEMSFEDISARALCCEAEVNLQRVRDGFLNDSKLAQLGIVSQRLSQSHLYIDDTAGLSIQEFRRRARKLKKKIPGLSVIFIDYLQLMKSTSKRAQGNREQEVAEISAGLKQTAKELGIPIVALAQLNRNGDQRTQGETRPKLSDLRESGAIEQDADFVGMPYREEYYIKNPEKRKDKAETWAAENECDPADWERLAELIVAKQRNGPVGSVPLWFDAPYTRFTSRTKKLYSNNDEERQG